MPSMATMTESRNENETYKQPDKSAREEIQELRHALARGARAAVGYEVLGVDSPS